jgi:hypothetical protein
MSNNMPPVGTTSDTWDEEFNSFVVYLNSYVQYAISQQLLGRLLTLLDASCEPGTKTEALKDLVKQECHATYDDIWRQNSHLDQNYKIKAIPQTSPMSHPITK